MDIKVLGTGCAKCKKLYEEVEAVVAKLGIDATVHKVESIEEISKYGLVITPALVIDGTIKSSGKLPAADKISEWLQRASN